MSIENPSFAIESVTPMKTKFKGLPLVTKRAEDRNIVESVISHRLLLEPEELQDTEFFGRRHEGTAYVYRTGLRGEAKLVGNCYGNAEVGNDGAYQLSTGWAIKNPGGLASFLPPHHGEWNVVTFSETIEPPEELALPRKEKSRLSRFLQLPRGRN